MKVAKPSTTLRKARLLRAGTPRRTATGSPAEADRVQVYDGSRLVPIEAAGG